MRTFESTSWMLILITVALRKLSIRYYCWHDTKKSIYIASHNPSNKLKQSIDLNLLVVYIKITTLLDLVDLGNMNFVSSNETTPTKIWLYRVFLSSMADSATKIFHLSHFYRSKKCVWHASTFYTTHFLFHYRNVLTLNDTKRR